MCHMSICAGAFVLTKSLCMTKGASCSEVSRTLFDLFVFAILIGSSDAVTQSFDRLNCETFVLFLTSRDAKRGFS